MNAAQKGRGSCIPRAGFIKSAESHLEERFGDQRPVRGLAVLALEKTDHILAYGGGRRLRVGRRK